MTAADRGGRTPQRVSGLSRQAAMAGQQATAAATGDGLPGPGWATPVAAGMFAVSMALLLAVFQAFSRRPWSMLDLRVYLWGGTLLHHSQDPYVYTYLDSGLRFTYTPLAAGVFALMAVVSPHIMKGLITVGSVVSLLAVLWLTWGTLESWSSRRRLGATLAVAAVALWIEPVRQTLSFGQVNLLLMLIIVADLCLPDSCWWKGVGVGIAAGFKLTPLVFVPYLLLTRRFRAAAVSAATFALTVLGSAVLLPKAAEDYWFDGLFLNPNRVGPVGYIGNQSLYGAIQRLLGSAAAARPYQLVTAAAVGTAGLLLAAWASRRGQEIVGILTCALTGLLISPVSWSHHWVWVAPILVVLADLAMRPPSRPAARHSRWARWLGVTTVVVLFSGLLWTVPARAAEGRVMTAFQQLVGDLYVLAGLAGLCVIAGLLALERRRLGTGPLNTVKPGRSP
jgi:alpha-1,2-mannosyltransferase